MDLPILHSDPASAPAALLRTAKKALTVLAECSADAELVAGCTACCAPERGSVPWTNAVFDLHLAQARPAEGIVGEIENHFGERGGRWRLALSAGDDFEPALLDNLLQRGWSRSSADLLVMQSLIQPRALEKSVQVLSARAVRQQYGEFARALAQERLAHAGAAPGRGPTWFAGAAAEEVAACLVDQLDDSRLDIHVGRVEKEPVAVASVLSLGDIGVLQHVDRLTAAGAEAALVRVLADLLELCSRAQFKSLCALVTDGETIKREALESFGMVKVAQTSVLLRPAQ